MSKGSSKKNFTPTRLLKPSQRSLLKNRLGSNLTKFRKMKGYSFVELEALTGIDEANLRKHENGTREPSIPTVVIIAKALGVSPLELLDIDYDLDGML